MIKGLLYRVAAATLVASVPRLLTALLELRFELTALGYPSAIFDSCFQDFVFTQRFEHAYSVWRSLYASVKARVAAANFKPP